MSADLEFEDAESYKKMLKEIEPYTTSLKVLGEYKQGNKIDWTWNEFLIEYKITMIISPANKLEHINEYYFSRKLKQIAQLKAEGKPIINLGIGNPDQAPSSATIDALIHAAQNTRNHGYQSYIGIPELRKAMSNWYQHTYDVSLDAATEILPLLGSKEGISHISNAFLNPGDKVLVPNPGYPTSSSATY